MPKRAVQQIQKPPEHIRPQVAVLVYRDVFTQLDTQSKLYLESNFASKAFVNFCKGQIEKVKEDMINLSPRADWSQEDYFQLSNDMRLAWRFWKDLLQYAEEFVQQLKDSNEGN